MIFVTVGTEQYPFDRLLKIIEAALENLELNEEVFAQIGNCQFKPQLYNHEKFIDFENMTELINKAEIVVSHAGEGTTLLCLMLGKVPILFPRDVRFKEQVDNHQMELARKMSESKKALVAYTNKELIYQIKNYRNLIISQKLSSSCNNNNQLIDYLKQLCATRK
jgi:UDP-N-acetylglucosamine transferase subunit ALG13